jgi:hypothetical protein
MKGGAQLWEDLRKRRPGGFDGRKDAIAIGSYVEETFRDAPSNLIDAVQLFQNPPLLQDIIDYAVFHFIRELGARCYISNSQLPCVLTMASLSERFVPALFEHNLDRLYRPDAPSEDQPKFSIHLASMMIEADRSRGEQRTYLGSVGRATDKRLFPMDVTERVFTPSEAEIDAALFHGSTFRTKTPSENTPSGTTLLLLSIARAFHVVPDLVEDMRRYYSDRRFSTTSRSRRAISKILKRTTLIVVARAIIPHLFAACCTTLVHIGTSFENVRVDVGLQTDTPPPSATTLDPEYSNELSGAIVVGGGAIVTLNLGNTLLFHIGALSADMSKTKGSILGSFVNLAHTWFALPGDGGSSMTRGLVALRKGTTITENTTLNLEYRKERFFSILFAMVNALSPTEEMKEREEGMIYRHIFRHVLLSVDAQDSARGAMGKHVDEDAFHRLSKLERAETLFPKPLPRADPESEYISMLWLSSRASELDVLINRRERSAERSGAMEAALLSKAQIDALKAAMAETMGDRPGLPPTVLHDGGQGKGVPILTTFPVSEEVIRDALRLNTPVVLSKALTNSLQAFGNEEDGFPFKWSFRLEDVIVTPMGEIPPSAPRRKDSSPERPGEFLEDPTRNIEEMTTILTTVFGITREQIASWLQIRKIDPNDPRHMEKLRELAEVVKQARSDAEDAKQRAEDSQSQVESLRGQVDTLQSSLDQANEDSAESAAQAESLTSELSSEKKALEESRADVSTLAEEVDRLAQEILELREQGKQIPKDLSDDLRRCQRDLDIANKNLAIAEKDRMKFFILIEVLNHMAEKEENTALKRVLRDDPPGGLNDMYMYVKALGFDITEVPENLMSWDEEVTSEAKRAFSRADAKRPEYVLSQEKLNEIDEALAEEEERERRRREREERRAREYEEVSSPVAKEPEHEETIAVVVVDAPEVSDIPEIPEVVEIAEVTEVVEENSGISLSRILEKVDSRPGFALSPAGKKLQSHKKVPKKTVRISLCSRTTEDEEKATPLSQSHHVVCTKGFCDSALFLGSAERKSVEHMSALVDHRLGLFSGKEEPLKLPEIKSEEMEVKEEVKETKVPEQLPITTVAEEQTLLPVDAPESATEEDVVQLFIGESDESVLYIDDYRDGGEGAENAIDEMHRPSIGASVISEPLDQSYAQELYVDQPMPLVDSGSTLEGCESGEALENTAAGGYEDYYYYAAVEEDEDGAIPYSVGSDGYYYASEPVYDDAAWPTQSIHSYAVPTNKRCEVLHYGRRPFPAFRDFRGIPKATASSPRKWRGRDRGGAKQTEEFRDQARSAITVLVAGSLAIASTRIYQETHTRPHWKKRGRKGKKPIGKPVEEDDTLSLKHLTMPKKFDDSCRRANKESETVPKAEEMILKEWGKLLELNPYDVLCSPSPNSKKGRLLHLVQKLSGAIEAGHSNRAREAMLRLCELASFSKNVRITMANLVREMHVATSQFRCTNNRNGMMECVRRANAIKI